MLGHYIPFEGTFYFEEMEPDVGVEEMLKQISDEGGLTIAELRTLLKSRERK